MSYTSRRYEFSFNCPYLITSPLSCLTFYFLSLYKFFPHCDNRSLLLSSYGRSSRPRSIPPRRGGLPAKSLTRDPDRKCEKVRARPSLGTNKAACIPTHGGSHISASCTPRRVHETTHRRRLPLTDPRIHEWSVGYQWAARCYPHALSTGALSTPHRHFRACSRSHAIARARLRRVTTTEKATMRTHEITRRDHVTFFS